MLKAGLEDVEVSAKDCGTGFCWAQKMKQNEVALMINCLLVLRVLMKVVGTGVLREVSLGF